MNSSKSILIVCCLAGAAFVAGTLLVASESDHIYGRGVHAFFDHNYKETVTILLQAEEVKSNDPRVYYFLGLAYLRQEMNEQADQYFEKAAQLEFNGRSLRDYDVSESLRRIQGTERLRLEKIRTVERVNAQKREQLHRKARYGADNTAEREALRQSTPQNQQEDWAMLQQMIDDLGNNAFGLKPMDPTASVDEGIAVKRQVTALFGEAREIVIEKPEVRRQATTRVRPQATERTGRSFVNPDVSVVETPVNVGGSAAFTDANLLRNVQTGIARELGKGLGTMFSKKAE